MFGTTGMSRRLRRITCLGMLAAMVPLTLSCYGRFPLTHAVYNMNGDAGASLGENRTQHKIVQSVVFWVLWIIPVYEVAIFADAVVLNLIEFWTGDTVDIGSVQESNGTRVALQPSADGREAVLTVTQNGKLLTEQHVTKLNATTFEMRGPFGTANREDHKDFIGRHPVE